MRVSRGLAWTLLVLGFFTAGLLRQFHDETPTSPLMSPVVGSLLFAVIFLLLLVSAREWRLGATRGRGVRLGSLTPVLLMLFVEKWASITFYPPLLYALAPAGASPELLDALFRALGGGALLVVVLLVARFSRPARRKTWQRARPRRWPAAAVAMLAVLCACYAIIGGLGWLLGGELRIVLPRAGALTAWVLAGQALLAFSEEVYYRGLLMAEMERLAPRLGARDPALRRWIALVATAVLFGMEHLRLGPPWSDSLRQSVFTVSLGLLLGILVMLSTNLHYAGGIHAWINWLLLGAAPHFVDTSGLPAVPPGTYIGVTLILAFSVALGLGRLRRIALTPASVRPG